MPKPLMSSLPIEIHKYVLEIVQGIKSRSARDEAARELATHAEEILSELRSNGESEEEAIRAVKLRLGSPSELQHNYIAAYRTPAMRIFAIVSAALISICFCILAVGFAKYKIDMDAWESSSREEISKRFPEFEKLQEALSKDPFFKPQASKRDAGEILNDVLKWRSTDTDGTGLTEGLSRKIRSLKINSTTIDELKSIDVSSVDVSWMQSLSQYGFWDLYRVDRGQRALEDAVRKKQFVPKVPEVAALLSLARIRFVKGLQSGNVRQALSEIEELSRLLASSEILLTVSIGLRIRFNELPALERKAREAGLLTDKIAYTEETTPSPQWKAVQMFTAILEEPSGTEDLMNQILAHPEWTVGRCAALDEMKLTQAAWSPYLESEPWPFERDLSLAASIRNKILKQSESSCRLTWPRSGNFENIVATSDFDPAPGTWMVNRVVEKIPYLRRVAGVGFAKLLMPGFPKEN